MILSKNLKQIQLGSNLNSKFILYIQFIVVPLFYQKGDNKP
jgi:hypothetical protein